MPIDLTTQYLPYVDEAFSRESKRELVTNKDFSWIYANEVKIYSVTTSNMNDYDRAGDSSGYSRYGAIERLGATTQTMRLRRDRSFTFAIDTLDMDETQRILAGESALARQIREVIIPEIDSWVYNEMCAHAGIQHPHAELPPPVLGEVTQKYDIYNRILQANEDLDDNLVPETGRFIILSPRYYTMLKKSDNLMTQSDIGQEMRNKGVVGYVDGVAVIKVPASRLPANFMYLVGHPCATVAPVKLENYQIHEDPPGISGNLVEGRINYDAFVLKNKKNALVYGFVETP